MKKAVIWFFGLLASLTIYQAVEGHVVLLSKESYELHVAPIYLAILKLVPTMPGDGGSHDISGIYWITYKGELTDIGYANSLPIQRAGTSTRLEDHTYYFYCGKLNFKNDYSPSLWAPMEFSDPVWCK